LPYNKKQIYLVAKKDHTLLEAVDLIGQTLYEAAPFGLQAEVIASAIAEIHNNPEIELSVALQHGLQDWDI
jgi:hypothetical protein